MHASNLAHLLHRPIELRVEEPRLPRLLAQAAALPVALVPRLVARTLHLGKFMVEQNPVGGLVARVGVRDGLKLHGDWRQAYNKVLDFYSKF